MLENTEENIEKTSETAEKKVAEIPKNTEETEKVEEVSVDETTKAVEEIEKSVAEEAEKDKPKEDDIIAIDYSNLSLEDLVKELQKLLKNNPVNKIKNQVDSIKTNFNQRFGSLLTEKKEAFLAAGGNSIDFQFSSPIKSEYNTLLSEYKKHRDTYYGNLEKQLSENLEKRLQVIEDLKKLIVEGNTATMYKNFKELQNTWRAIGPVSKTKYNDTWKIYHHHVERFYDLLNLSKNYRDLDFKHNLEQKIKIVENAEMLIYHKDINIAFKELQKLHKTWKEDIGPVAKEMREEIWQKFSAATKKIHDKRHEYFKSKKSEYKEIIEKKLEVIAAINAYDTSNNKTHNDWQKSIKDVTDLRENYFKEGKLPYSKSEEIWQKFKSATKKFNSAKNAFYKKEKSGQQENLKKKIALVEHAESLKDSEDWEMATNAMKKVQADWKKIGHVPRKFSDDIWKRFKAACNHYFDRYHQQKNAISKEQQEVIDAKKAFLESLKTTENLTKDVVLEAMNTWKDLGRLPRNLRHLDSKFNKQIDALLENLSLDKKEVKMLKFANMIDSYVADNNIYKLDSEQLFVRKKIDEITREIQQLENNLSFFSSTKTDNPLILNVKTKVNEFKEDLAVWKKKLNYIKKLDY
ncbi:MAG: DUF349 domain-containing protein [Polaribacter sp.]